MSNSLWPHRLQHVGLLCPSLSPLVSSNSCALSQWFYLAISSYFTPFSFCLQSFPASRSFESALCIRWPKFWSFSFSNSPSSEYLGLISLLSKGLISLLQHDNSKSSILQHLAFFMVQLSHAHMTTGKTIALILWNFVGKMRSLLYCCLFIIVYVYQSFPSKEQMSFNFMAAINICSDFWSQGK